MYQGKVELESIVHRLGERAAQGHPVAILWDMDGTLVDTRPRMLASVHTYGRTDVRLTDVSPSWQETAQRLNLDPKRFQAVWQRVFWAYESFDADIENEEVSELARLAESLGIQTVIVTGRIEELRPVTARQLERLGLKPTRVFLKSEVGDCTPSVKAEVITQLAEEGLEMGAFVTDSVEEIAAVTPSVLSKAPDLACIFVELEGTSPELREGVHRFPVPFRNGPRMAERPRVLGTRAGPMSFGYEAEYEIPTADALLRLYDPEPEAGVPVEQWHAWSARERSDWVFSRFPEPHSEEFDLPLRRNERHPELDFLPPGLFVDSDGNLELVSQPTEELAALWDQLERLEHVCGPALLQVTVSVPVASLRGGVEALDGFLSFHHLLDILERLKVGSEMYEEDPGRDVLLPFLHPWLGPMTADKHRFLRQYLEANARGERLDKKWVRLVDRAFSSFKYISGTAYRPALAGRDRIALEIRDGHRNKALLAQRVVRTVTCLLGGLEPYAPFARTLAFEPERDYESFPPAVREMLERVIPTRVRPEIDYMYSDYDRVALQVYRNFAFALKDYSDVELALGEEVPWEEARSAYLERMVSLVNSEPGDLRRRLQGALALFSVESGLYESMQAFSERVMPQSDSVRSLLPLLHAVPRTSWSGSLASRLQRLQRRWPEQVFLIPNNMFELRGSRYIYRTCVFISVDGLSSGELARLREDYLRAVASLTLGIRVTDRGSLELRYGEKVFSPGSWANEARDYAPFSVGAGIEPLLELSGLEAYCLGRQLVAHEPCDEAARRVSASGWLRHLSMGLQGEILEDVLGLPHPESIETAAQVIDRVMSCSEEARLSHIVCWTRLRYTRKTLSIWVAPSILRSGFPESLSGDGTLAERLQGLVSRWPGHAKLVEGVPFGFPGQSKERTVLVLALAGMSDEEFDRFTEDYLNCIGADTISFPCRLRAEHLRTRIGTLALALSAEGVRVDFYEPPWKRRRMEALIELEPKEVERLREYVGAVIDDTLGTLGPITLGGGCRTTVGKLKDNRPTDGGEHNCTTWVTLAPVQEGRDLATLVGMPASWTSHDNPGWWSMFLTGASRSPRVHTVIYWTDLPLDEEPCAPGVQIPWDFNPH